VQTESLVRNETVTAVLALHDTLVSEHIRRPRHLHLRHVQRVSYQQLRVLLLDKDVLHFSGTALLPILRQHREL